MLKHSIPGITIENSIAIQHIDGSPQITGVSIGALHVGTLVPRLAFGQIIARPLEELQVRRPLVVVIDALDEASHEDDNAFVDLVKHMLDYRETLPLRFIFTARTNVAAVIDRIETETVNITDDEPLDVDDVRLYALDALRDLGHPAHSEREHFASRLSSAASGNFLYAEFQLVAIRNDPQHWRETDLPEGLHGAYRSFLQREIASSRTDARWMRRYRPVLGLLTVARGDGLTPSHLEAVTGLPTSEIEDTVASCGPFLRIREGSAAIRVYHESFREFLARDPIYHVFPEESADSLVEHCLTALVERDGATTDEYALRYLVEHLQDLRRYGEVVMLSLNDRFLESQDALALRHELSLATQDAGLRAALMAQDIERFAAIAVASGFTRDRISKITPVQAFADDGLAGALSTAKAMDPHDRAMWYLVLAIGPHTQPDAMETGAVLGELLALEPSVLPEYWQDTAAALLARTMSVDRAATLKLQEALLDNWGRQHLVNFLIDAGCLVDAAEVLESFSDSDIWLRAVHAVAEEYFRFGRTDEAIALVARMVASVPWVSEFLTIYDDDPEIVGIDCEPKFLASLYAGVPKARTELFRALANKDAQASRAALVIAARAAYYYHHIGDHDAESACLSFCLDKRTQTLEPPSWSDQEKVEVPNRQSQAFAWLYLAETFYYLNRQPEARQFLRMAADTKPPLAAMRSQWGQINDTHDDPQHRFCLQGLTLRLSQAGARLREPEIHYAAAQELMDLGSRDAVRALLADIETSVGDQPKLREKFTDALSRTREFASGSLRAAETQRLVRSPAVASLPECEQATDTANALLLDVLEQALSRDATLLFDCCKALATVAATLGRNELHDKSAEIYRVRSWVTWLNRRSVLTWLVEHLAERGAAAEIQELLDGFDVRGLGTSLYENVWESQITDLVLRTGDLDGAVQVLKVLKPKGEFAALGHLRELVTSCLANGDIMTRTSHHLLWLASRIAARNGDDERAALLREHASAEATKLEDTLRGRQETASSEEEFGRASMLAQAARQLAEMGLVERAEETFRLACSYHSSAEFSWDTYRFAFAGIVQTYDEQAADRDASVVSQIARRCDYIEGFAHSGHLEAVQGHIDNIMEYVRIFKTVHHRDQALQRIARMLGYVGRWAEARDVVDSMHSSREYAAVDVLVAVSKSPIAAGVTPAVGGSEDLIDIVRLSCRSLSGAILTCAALGDGLFPFDAAVARSFDALVSTVTRRAEVITGGE